MSDTIDSLTTEEEREDVKMGAWMLVELNRIDVAAEPLLKMGAWISALYIYILTNVIIESL